MIAGIFKAITLIMIALIGIFFIVFSPQYSTSLEFQGHKITIERDKYGIPHIIAPNRKSYYYAWGTVMAEDRLFQCTFRRLFGQGRLSQYLGERTIKADIMMRDLGLRQIAKRIAQKMKKENLTAYGQFEAYVQGINDNVARRLTLPLQYHILGIKWEKWDLESIFLLHKLLEWSISHNMLDQYIRSGLLANFTIPEINRLIPNTKQQWAFASATTIKDEDIPEKFIHKDFKQQQFQPVQIQKIIQLGMPEIFISADGSNSWAISGKHTKSGKPILSGDPHLDSAMPSHWYQIRGSYIQNGKKTSFSTYSPPGILTLSGKGQYLAIGITVIQSDTQDLYLEKIRYNEYFIDGQWKNLKIRNETILIKTAEGVKIYNHTVRLTHRGPILNYIVSQFGTYELTQKLSLSWTGYNEQYSSYVTCLRAFQIDNFQQLQAKFLKNATSHFFSLSLLGATADNHIFYHQSGLSVIRPSIQAGSYIKNGTTSKDDWLGFMHPEDRLTVIDPKSGFIVTSNNRPASHIFQNGFFNYIPFTARADRLEELVKAEIASGRKITNQFAKSLLYDTVDIYCKQILPKMTAIISSANQTHFNFDCDFKPTSYQATIYEVFMIELWLKIKHLPNQNFSVISLHNTHQSLYRYIQEAYLNDLQKQKIMIEIWQKTKEKLTEHFKTPDHSKWLWGKFHKDVTAQLPLGSHPILGKIYNRQAPGFGNFHTPNIAKCNKIEQGNYDTSHRANLRSISDFGGPSWWVIDSGVSQNILSPHYDDQWKLLMNQQLLPMDLQSKQSEQL